MALEEKLDSLRRASAARVRPETAEIMQRTTRDLESSDILQGVIKSGEPLPEGSLTDAKGKSRPISSFWQHRPLWLSFYRGVW